MNRTAPREEHRALSLGLALAMHGLIAALLYFGVQWRTHPAAPVEVELWAGVPQSSPTPAPVTKPTPKPVQEPETKPEPEVAKPDIQVEKSKPTKPKPEPVKPPPKPEPPKKVEPKKPEPAPLKPPKTEPGRNKVLSELAGKLDKPPLDASVALAALAARQSAAEATGKANAMEAYFARVRKLIRDKMNYAGDDSGNLTAEFSVTLLPGMSILSVELTKSSGVPAFDEAAKRAILLAEQYPQLPPGVDFSSMRKHKLKYRQHES